MIPGAVSGHASDDLFALGGQTAELTAAFDWSASSVGSVETWPASLRFAVRTVLVSKFPMVLTWGTDFVQFYNDAYAPLIGAKHPAIGQDLRDTLAEVWDVLGPPIEHAMAAREASWMPRMQLLLERSGYREETYFAATHAPAFDDDGRVAGMHAVCTETTARVLGERRQRLLHDLATAGAPLGDEPAIIASLARALEGAPLVVPFAALYLADADGDTLTRSVVVGCAPDALPTTLPAGADPLPADVRALGVHGGPWGDPVTTAVTLPVRASSTSEPLGVLVVGCNPNRAVDADYRTFHEMLAGQFAAAVTTVRAFETERHRAASLAELDRAKTTFFADVSHELRTPLTLLLGPLGDVLDDPATSLDPDVAAQLSMAVRNGRQLQRLVNDLLGFVSIEAGRANPVRTRTDIATFTAELAGLFRAATERAGLVLTVDCAPLDRPAHVDPQMWEKIVVNLLANALKYTFVGGIEVSLHGGDDGIVLAVSDTGVGIAAGELPQLFQRFHRATDTVSRTREGTGLGLALVHELTELHGGEASVASEPGVGSTFTVRIPWGTPDSARGAAVEPSDAARGEAADWEQTISRPDDAGSTEGAGILVVDDNVDMRAYLTRLLSPHWPVRTAENGEQALAAITDSPPDLVLTDVMMPRVDGFELLRTLRAEPATRSIPVIMLTARAGQEAAVEGLQAGADDYLAKPFRAPELLARVRVAMDRGAGRSPAAPQVPAPRPEAEPVGRREPVPPLRETLSGTRSSWRLPATAAAIPPLRRGLRMFLDGTGLDPDQNYDVVLAACEAATNAIEHAQDPSEPYIDVAAEADRTHVRITVRDYGQWRERMPSMDRGRGSTLMSVVGEITATPSPEGTTVDILSRRVDHDTH